MCKIKDDESARKYLLDLGWTYHSAGARNAIVNGYRPIHKIMAGVLAKQGYPIEYHHMSSHKEFNKPRVFFAPKNMVYAPLKA